MRRNVLLMGSRYPLREHAPWQDSPRPGRRALPAVTPPLYATTPYNTVQMWRFTLRVTAGLAGRLESVPFIPSTVALILPACREGSFLLKLIPTMAGALTVASARVERQSWYVKRWPGSELFDGIVFFVLMPFLSCSSKLRTKESVSSLAQEAKQQRASSVLVEPYPLTNFVGYSLATP